MTASELREFYEKLYFLEIDARDKLHGRLQLSLTLLLAVGGAVLYLFQNADYQRGAWTGIRVAFLFFFCGGLTMLAIAAALFTKAFFNHAYQFLPDSVETALYKARLEDTYAEFEGHQALVSDALDKYVTDYYVEYGAFNTRVNDRRSAYLHACNGWMIAAAVLMMLAYLAFHFGDLDKGRIKTPAEVHITKPVDVRMHDKGK